MGRLRPGVSLGRRTFRTNYFMKVILLGNIFGGYSTRFI